MRGGRARARIFTVRRLRGRWTRWMTSLAALRAEHENAGPRQIAFGDWERGAVAGFEAPLHPSPPPRSHPPGYAEVPRHENRTKSHEKTACQERTMSITPRDESLFPVLGCDKFFVTFRETFVSRRAAETPRRGGFSCSARSAARLVNRRLHLPRNRRTVIIPRTRARGSLLLSMTCLRPSRGSWASRRHAENRKARPL